MAKEDLQGMSLKEYELLMEELGQPRYRAVQLFQWVHGKAIKDMKEATNLPKTLIEKLEQRVSFQPLKIIKKQVSEIDDTAKFLFALSDGQRVETVRMSYKRKNSRDRHTVCVSTQVGCAMGCVFCATGLSGWVRNLTVGEIVGQVLAVQRNLQTVYPGEKITNVVFMGMGEPLLNYDNVIKALHILNAPDGLNIGMRRISLSTCGIVPGIRKLAEEKLPIVLAISLHAPNNKLRDELMPINRKYPLEELLAACDYYINSTGRRITFEYALIEGKNDSMEHARELGRLLSGMLANVNLIPFNPVLETGLTRPGIKKVRAFARELESFGIEVAIREEKGSDIEAACGQLRRREVN